MSRFSIRSLVYACHAVIWFVAIITIAAERSAATKAFLAGLTGHHWTAKGAISFVIFMAIAFVFAKKDDPQDVVALVRGALISAILAAGTILVFYVLHFRGLA